jgi:hypothetical protein
LTQDSSFAGSSQARRLVPEQAIVDFINKLDADSADTDDVDSDDGNDDADTGGAA